MEKTNRTDVQNIDPATIATTPEITERKNSEETASQNQTAENFPAAGGGLPDDALDPAPAEIRRHIIRRVSELIATCTDPKKLMDTHEALLKWEQTAVRPQESLFERIARELAATEPGNDEE